jgi:hypothetical protein
MTNRRERLVRSQILLSNDKLLAVPLLPFSVKSKSLRCLLATSRQFAYNEIGLDALSFLEPGK